MPGFLGKERSTKASGKAQKGNFSRRTNWAPKESRASCRGKIKFMEKKKQTRKTKTTKAKCGLCGKSGKLIKTDCCGNWICDDSDKYVMFSYAYNSCYRNHDRYTLCAFHYHEEHKGDWKSCKKCKESFHPEIYDWYGSNEYNFEKLDELLPFTPIRCGKCGSMIIQSQGGYASLPDGTYRCDRCYEK